MYTMLTVWHQNPCKFNIQNNLRKVKYSNIVYFTFYGNWSCIIFELHVFKVFVFVKHIQIMQVLMFCSIELEYLGRKWLEDCSYLAANKTNDFRNNYFLFLKYNSLCTCINEDETNQKIKKFKFSTAYAQVYRIIFLLTKNL